MGEIVAMEKIIVEKMAEGTMTDVVQQADHTHVLLDERRRRALVAQDFSQRWVKVLGKFPRQVHGAQGMLETAMFRRRIDPTGALELVDVAQPLHPRRVDQR